MLLRKKYIYIYNRQLWNDEKGYEAAEEKN